MVKLRVVWSLQAKQDLSRIYFFLRKTGAPSGAAKKVIKKIHHKVGILRAETLRTGRILVTEGQNTPEGEYRYLISDYYKIIYKIENDKLIIISTIFDNRLDPHKLRL